MSKLVVLSGIPGCGKSTFIEKYCWNGPVIILSTDAIRKQLTGDMGNLTRDDLVWKYIYSILSNPSVDATYVVDATNLTFRRRKSYLKYKSNFEKISLYYLMVDIDVALRRNAERDRNVPENVIRQMQEMARENLNFEELVAAGYDEVRVICND